MSNEQILYELRRTQNPIDHKFNLNLSIVIPIDQPAVQAYLQRLRSTNPYLWTGELVSNSSFPSPQILGELSLVRLTQVTWLTVNFSRGDENSGGPSKEDHYKIGGVCGNGKQHSVDLYWLQRPPGLSLNCNIRNVDGEGTFRSY